MKSVLLTLLIILTVIEIESCANSGRCRVKLSDGSTDLLFYPYIGQVIKKK